MKKLFGMLALALTLGFGAATVASASNSADCCQPAASCCVEKASCCTVK